jgi:hypothetical protein
MDFKTMESKIRHHKYTSLTDFQVRHFNQQTCDDDGITIM